MTRVLIALGVVILLSTGHLLADQPLKLPPIKSVRTGPQGQFIVNGEPFFPIMSWAQAQKRYPLLRTVGINTFCGGGEGAEVDITKAALDAGGYRIAGFDKAIIGKSNLLCWIHGDEPDLYQNVQDITIIKGETLTINKSNPLERIFDTQTGRDAVLDPLEKASFMLMPQKPVTLSSLKIMVNNDKENSLPQIRELAITGDGKLLTVARLPRKTKTFIDIKLPKTVTIQEIEFSVQSVYPGKGEYGLCTEIQGFGPDGNENILAAPVRREARHKPPHLAADYRRIINADMTRPVMVTFTSGFMEEDNRFTPQQREEYYPDYVKYCDSVGFDTYPIYGWNRPEWMIRVASGVSQLRAISGPSKAVYAWVETSKGSKWITYENQKDVEPRHTRAEVWMAVIRGATAIGYFTHAWRPVFNEFACTDEMRAELKRLNGQITRLTPAILATPTTTEISIDAGKIDMHFKATQPDDNNLYIFAQNIDMQDNPARATITVDGLKAGTVIKVVDENRSIIAKEGFFTDSFAAIAEHIYLISK